MRNEITRIAFNFLASENDNTDIEIYDEIASEKGWNWNGEKYEPDNKVTPADFKEKLNGCTTKNITIHMNSRGGDVNSATVIAVAIQEARSNGKHVVCKIDGLCASAAVQIAVSCDEVIMHKSALLMIHNPMSFLLGYYSVNELKSVDNMLTAVKNSILNYYVDKTGLSKNKLSAMMDEETWMDGKEAVENGFADKLMFDEDDESGADDVINRVRTCINSASFKNIPEAYKPQNNIINTKGATEDMSTINTVDELVAKYPDLAAQLRQDAINSAQTSVTDAVNAERERIKAIDELAGKVSHDLLNKAKYETFATAENVAMEAIKTGAFVQGNIMNALVEDGEETKDVKGLGNEGNKGEKEEKEEQKNETKNHAEQVALDYLKKLGKVKE